MKRLFISMCSICLMCCIALLVTSVSALASAEESTIDKINTMVREHMAKSKIPNVSIAYIQDGEVNYLFYGEYPAGESLYQIGSTTKAFTALGILWLEDEGYLSLNDPVDLHIPWFTMKYDGAKIPGEDLTIANLLYQTSGFTNDETKFPRAEEGMTLEESVRAYVNSELAFYPSAQYAYANANYNTLGLLIEIVSGKSYQDFMEENICYPLGLRNTYSNPGTAIPSEPEMGDP